MDPLHDEDGNDFCCLECMVMYWEDEPDQIPERYRPATTPPIEPAATKP